MEKITQFLPKGFEFLVVFLIIVTVTLTSNWLARRAFSKLLQKSSDSMDITGFKFVGNALTAIIYTIGIIFIINEIPALKTFAGSLLAGAGILAAIVGFASQQAFSNIVSGVFLVLSKPFKVNDRLRIKETYVGIVEDITLRHTVIRDLENRRIIIPNSLMANEILINASYSTDPVCKFVEVSVSYNVDLSLAKTIMAEEIAKHPFYIDTRTQEEKDNGVPLVVIRLISMTDWALVLRGNAWAETPAKAFEMYCDLLESIKSRFDTEGVEIPYPHHVLIQNK